MAKIYCCAVKAVIVDMDQQNLQLNSQNCHAAFCTRHTMRVISHYNVSTINIVLGITVIITHKITVTAEIP